MRKRKKERRNSICMREKKRKEKNMSMCKNKNKVNSPVL
jgi:hypothetical protein